jgi:predicted O-methyltransferase YrrM
MLRRIVSILAVGAALTAPTAISAQPRASALPADLQRLLAEIRTRDTGQLAVSEEDGRFLRVLVASTRAKRVLEIGGASGYSAIWMAMGLREHGGTLVTIESDAARARELASNIARAGLADVVEVVSGDAFVQIPKLAGTFDLVFLDAWKRDYRRFFEMVFPRVNAGGVFVAHNVVNKRSEMGDFLAVIDDSPALFSTIVSPSGEGMSLTYKRREP